MKIVLVIVSVLMTITVLLTVSMQGYAANTGEATLHLETTLVGDKEQPTVSYFIPWKGTGRPDQLHWDIEVKNDRILEVVDRQILMRSNAIYSDLEMEKVLSVSR